MSRLLSAKTFLTAGVLTGAVLLFTGCETTSTHSTLSSATPIGDETFEDGAGKPPSAETLFRMGNILSAQGKNPNAEAVHRSTINRYPDFLPAYSELARLQIDRGATEAAIRTFDAALVVAPRDAIVHNNRGMCLMLLEHYEEARENFSVAAASDPENTRYSGNVALASGMLGEYEVALAQYREFLQPARAHYNLAVICDARNDAERAAIEYALAAGVEPLPVEGVSDVQFSAPAEGDVDMGPTTRKQ